MCVYRCYMFRVSFCIYTYIYIYIYICPACLYIYIYVYVARYLIYPIIFSTESWTTFMGHLLTKSVTRLLIHTSSPSLACSIIHSISHPIKYSFEHKAPTTHLYRIGNTQWPEVEILFEHLRTQNLEEQNAVSVFNRFQPTYKQFNYRGPSGRPKHHLSANKELSPSI